MVKTGEILVCGNCANVKNHPPGELNELNILIFWGGMKLMCYIECFIENFTM